jgi:filamentous hemagglutinin family protein
MTTNFSQRRTHPLRAIAAALFVVVAAAFPSSAQQLPTGGSVAAGNVSIGAPQHGTLNINQSTNQAIINWNTFSVGTGGTVNFNQPGASSATLNRVTSSTPSSIAGTINAPGTVMLVNPNGIAITKSGVINTGSFVASTLGIKNEDFLAGKYNFQGNGASAPVTNRGHINVSTGGFVALLGGRVSNSGVINAKLGKVGLGSGEMATIDLSGDGFMSVAVPSNQVQNLRDGHGRALVSNSGKINANGGTVVLSAATAKNAFQQAVNVPGSIRANSVGVRAGKIVLNGGDGGIVNVGGTLAANGGKRGNGGSITIAGAKISVPGKITASGQKGGHIAVTSVGNLSVAGKVSVKGRAGEGGRIDLAGKDIRLTGAKVNASGATGGGLVRIGGQFRGGKADASDPLYQPYVGRWDALPPIAAATRVTVPERGSTSPLAKSATAARPSFGRTKRHPLLARSSAQAEASPALAVTLKYPAKRCWISPDA